MCLQRDLRTNLADSPYVYADAERLAMVLRNLIDEAARTSRSDSPVTLLLRRHEADAEIGVRCRRLPAEERTCEAYGEYDDLGISRCVATTIVEAHGGTLREEIVDSEATAWIRLPAGETHVHA
jgi:signal transduction histidine kinase